MSDPITLEQVVNLFNGLNERIDEKHTSMQRRFDGLEVKMDLQGTRMGAVADRVLIIEQGRIYEKTQRDEDTRKTEKRMTFISGGLAVVVSAGFKLFEYFGGVHH